MEKQEILQLIDEAIKANIEANAKAEQAKAEAQELATAKAEVERLTAECSAKDETIAEKDAKIAELEKAVAEKDAEIEASAKEQPIVSDVKNLETKAKLDAGKKEKFTDFASMVKSVM